MSAATTTENGFDTARAESFGERIMDILNSGALATMISIGHRTGLFDTLSGLAPSSSEQIAERAGLQERYVREWLGAMVTGRIVEFDPDSETYGLPAEHASLLTRDARPNNMAVTCQWVPLLGCVEDEVVECFERGGGVPYSAYERFHAVMAEESDQTVVATLLSHILPAVPGLQEALAQGIDVLDVGCGSGLALCEMANAFPESRFTGYDVSSEAISNGAREASERGLDNVHFELKDVGELETGACFDLITAFDAIHDQARPKEVLDGIAAALRGGGTFLMQDIQGTSHVDHDISLPMSPLLYTISCMHCMTVSLSADGAGLGAMWGSETATDMLAEAGFSDVSVQALDHDAINFYYTARK